MCPENKMKGLTYCRSWPIHRKRVNRVCYIREKRTWISPFLEHLKEDLFPSNAAKAKKLVKEASKYTLVGQQLYRRDFSFPLLRCMDEEEFEYVIWEVHEDVYRTHKGGRALASKSTRGGYYCPTLNMTAWSTARVVSLYHITLAIYKWGVDTLGPFPTAPGQIKYLIVVVDYFTKWVEAEPIATISFASRSTENFCAQLKIKQLFTSVEHPQSNGQPEVTNKVILRGLQKCLEKAKGR
ncbi:hypothetical protein CR513_25656, partial [Mucuna pruriens]